MTAPSFVAVQTVRDYIGLNAGATSAYVDATIQSNIRTASEFLERATNRYFQNRTGVTLTLTSNGEANVDLPGVRTITSVTRAGSALVADTTYWLVPDAQQSGVYQAVTFGPYGSDYRSFPDWFDTNRDTQWQKYGTVSAFPNDLVIVADVGYTDGNLPEALLMACKVLAAWYTKRPDAVLTGGTAFPDATLSPLDELPPEVTQFVEDWRIGTHSAVSL